MAITIDSAVAALNRYCITYKKDINTRTRQGMVTENYLTPRTAMDSYVAPSANTTGDILQPFQCDWTPRFSVNFSAEEIRLQRIKLDIEFTCDDLEQWHEKWMCDWGEFGSGKNMTEWSFPRYIVEKELYPKITEELEYMSYNGAYAAPTAGTAGAYLTAVDGLKTKIAAAITANKLTPIAVGASTATTYYAKVKSFIDQLPNVYRVKGGTIFMNPDDVRAFQQDVYAQGFANHVGFSAPTCSDASEACVPFTNFKLVGLPSMIGSHRMIYSARPDNLIFVRRKGEPVLPKLTWESSKRTLSAWGEFHRAYGFEYAAELFVSDQA